MISRRSFEQAQRGGAELIRQAGIAVLPGDFERIEVADFGLGRLEVFGAQILTLVNTGKIAVKLIALQPGQTLPEHSHPQIGDYEGKEETIRCEWGELLLYGPGEPTPGARAALPEEKHGVFTQWGERRLLPGEQVTFAPNTPHWFQAGPGGAVVWSFSTKAVDLQDVFTDPDIQRQTVITEAEK
jgi:D-lyxose ketol-isomerase